ncbi:hypothetical protein Q9233_017887 [Columba guinea]|nr:hypothetical protein Q9233_017887 [Columba guinea]
MSSCSSRALTLLSSVFGACGLLLVGIAVSTDYWLYMEEGVVLPQNQSNAGLSLVVGLVLYISSINDEGAGVMSVYLFTIAHHCTPLHTIARRCTRISRCRRSR